MTRLKQLSDALVDAQVCRATTVRLDTEDLEALLAVVDAGQNVVSNWSRGDLAGAVNTLDLTIGALE